jgi:signal transduction histidine kinase
MSISRSLQLLAVVLFLLMMSATAAQLFQRRAAAIGNAHVQMDALDRLLGEETSRAMEPVNVILREVGEPRPDSTQREALRLRISDLHQLLAVEAVAADGTIRFSSRLSAADHLPPEGLALLARAATDASGAMLISAPVRQSDGRWAALAARRITAPDGRFDGMAVAWLNLGYFETFYKAAAPDRDGVVSLHNLDGVLLVRTPHEDRLSGRNEAGVVPFGELLAQGDASSAEMGSRILAIRTLPNAPLAITVSVGTADVLAGWRSEAWAFTFAAIAAGLVVATLMLQIARRSREVEALLAEQREVNISAHAANADMAVQMAERERAEQAQRQVQRVEAVGQLTGGVAHDFNNLLTILLGNLELLQSNSQAAPFAARLATMRAAAERGASLIGHLLAFARRQPLQPRAVDLGALVHAMQPLLQSAVGSQIGLAFELDDHAPAALVDPAQIELVILNLAINARDAMPAGGTLRLEVGAIQLEASPHPDAPHPGTYAFLRVIDSGIGMTEDVRSRAFEPYFTTKPLGTRSGLGLSQVYGVARQSGGQVRIDSRLGAGTTITVILPVAESVEPEVPAVAMPQAPGRAGGANLLVVDDDNDVRATTALLLRRAGYTVTEAGSAEQALKIIAETDDIELLLSDVVMPHVTGPELVRRAHALRPSLPVVFFSGYADLESITGTVSLARLVRKPFRPVDLTNVIEVVLAESRLAVLAG